MFIMYYPVLPSGVNIIVMSTSPVEITFMIAKDSIKTTYLEIRFIIVCSNVIMIVFGYG